MTCLKSSTSWLRRLPTLPLSMTNVLGTCGRALSSCSTCVRFFFCEERRQEGGEVKKHTRAGYRLNSSSWSKGSGVHANVNQAGFHTERGALGFLSPRPLKEIWKLWCHNCLNGYMYNSLNRPNYGGGHVDSAVGAQHLEFAICTASLARLLYSYSSLQP